MSNVYTYTTEIKNREYNTDLMKYITEYKELFNKTQRVVDCLANFYKNYKKEKKNNLNRDKK